MASERMDVMGWVNPHGERMDVTALGKGEFAAWVDNHYMGCFYELVAHRQMLTDGFNVIPIDTSRMAALTLLDARVTSAQRLEWEPEGEVRKRMEMEQLRPEATQAQEVGK